MKLKKRINREFIPSFEIKEVIKEYRQHNKSHLFEFRYQKEVRESIEACLKFIEEELRLN